MTGVYFVLRHGESVPSSEGRVCTSLEEGKDPKNGLTERGRGEVAKNTKIWAGANRERIRPFVTAGRFVVVASPFSRTLETARIAIETMNALFHAGIPLQENVELRERSFGDFDGRLGAEGPYRQVWDEDRLDENNTRHNVESPRAVRTRVLGVIEKLESESSRAGGVMALLVSHGDPLKFTQMFLEGKPVPSYSTAEFRELKFR